MLPFLQELITIIMGNTTLSNVKSHTYNNGIKESRMLKLTKRKKKQIKLKVAYVQKNV